MSEIAVQHGETGLTLNPDQGTLSLQFGPIQLSGHCRAEVSIDGRHVSILPGKRASDVSRQPATEPHGVGTRLVAKLETVASEIDLRVEAIVYDTQPLIALRIGIDNHGSRAVQAHTLTALASHHLNMGSGPLDGWVNGYHSWSFSGFIHHSQRQPRMVTNLLTRPHAENPTTHYPRQPGRYVGEWVGALIDGSTQALIAGFIGVERQFGQVYMDGRPGRQAIMLQNTADGVPIAPGDTLWGEWAILYRIKLPHADPLGVYAETVVRLTPGRYPSPHPTPGWSSWYQFFDAVTAEDMADNQAALRTQCDRLPLQLVQLDDGYQPAWGDWLTHNAKFPHGVSGWAETVRADGFEPGLWLAPFTVDSQSRIYHDHPDALLRTPRGRPVHGGFLIKRWIKGLDPTHPATQDFIRRTIETIVHQWGIRYLKLDFLYCGALPGVRYDPTKTRAQGLREGLQLIREVAGEDAVILGCGCPFGPALGIVDLMRVSPDVAPYWYPEVLNLKQPFRGDFSLPAARNSISISLQRSWTHRRWWWLDADNLLVREQQTLNASEVQTLVTVIGLIGSHLIVSDDLPRITDERLRWAASLLPMLNGGAEIPTLLTQRTPDRLIRHFSGPAGPHWVVGLINWEDIPRSLSLWLPDLGLPSDSPTLVCDFWARQVYVHEGEYLNTNPIPPHGCALIALRPVAPGPQMAGSDLHISMGGEIVAWEASQYGLRCTVRLGRKTEGTLWFKLPSAPRAAACDGHAVAILPSSNTDLHAIPLSIDGEAEVAIQL